METQSAPNTGVEANERMAAAMYPEPAPSAVDPAPNAAIAALRAADPARQMYPDATAFGPNGGSVREMALVLNPAGTAAALETQQQALAAVFVDIGADRDTVSRWAGYAAAFAAKPPTEQERAASQRTALRELRETYGAGFDDALRDAKLLVQRDPRLAGLLERTQIGDHPDVVRVIAELGRAQRASGKLK